MTLPYPNGTLQPNRIEQNGTEQNGHHVSAIYLLSEPEKKGAMVMADF